MKPRRLPALGAVDWRQWAERAGAVVYPRRCPFCGEILAGGGWQALACARCLPRVERLAHRPPRLPENAHCFSAVSGAAAPFYYDGAVRHAILLCKQHGHPWYARELADWIAVRVYGALPPAAPGRRPDYRALPGLPLYGCIVPVPPRVPKPGALDLPMLLAARLGRVLGVPVVRALHTTRPLQPQKRLDLPGRLLNAKDAYAALPGVDLQGKRVLLVDDIITTGATVSACAQALLLAGAAQVFATAVAASERPPKEQTNDPQDQEKQQ